MTPTLTPTGSPPLLLYLDLKDWIGLAKARIGHRAGASYEPAYEKLKRATAAGTVKTPLSFAHYAEIEARIKSLRQRNDIALSMAELTGYAALTSREPLLRSEFRVSLARALGVPLPSARALAPIGYGVGHAFGHPFRGTITGPGTEDPNTFDERRVNLAIDALEEWVGGGWRFSRRDLYRRHCGRRTHDPGQQPEVHRLGRRRA